MQETPQPTVHEAVADARRKLDAVHARIAEACARSGRDPGEVTVLAVSKFQPLVLLEAAVIAGQIDLAENYAQELRDKAAALDDLPIRWHAIGHLQTNKAKYVARAAYAFHALDRIEIAQELGKRRQGPALKCFVEVNVTGEPTKSGISPDEVPALVDAAGKVQGLEVVGLMTMPPFTTDPEASRPHFSRLRELADGLGLSQLSMGTTMDFEVAVEEGATSLRVGRDIFGLRHAQLAGTPFERHPAALMELQS